MTTPNRDHLTLIVWAVISHLDVAAAKAVCQWIGEVNNETER